MSNDPRHSINNSFILIILKEMFTFLFVGKVTNMRMNPFIILTSVLHLQLSDQKRVFALYATGLAPASGGVLLHLSYDLHVHHDRGQK